MVRQGGGVMEEGWYGGWKGGGRLRADWKCVEVAALAGDKHGREGKNGWNVWEMARQKWRDNGMVAAV